MNCKHAALLLAGALMAAGCGNHLMYNTKIDEYRNPNIAAAHFATITVMPVDPEDKFAMQMAGRVRAKLKADSVPLAQPLKLADEGEVGMAEICPPDQHVDYQGVLFVAWDRLILRDCDTKAVAFRTLGNYAGIDAMLQRFVKYLHEKPAQ